MLVFAFVEMEVTAVLGVVEDFARLGECSRRKLRGRLDAALFSEKAGLFPVFPRFERLALDVLWEADAKALIDVQPDDENARAPREVRPVLPKRPVRRVVVNADLNLLDLSCLREVFGR